MPQATPSASLDITYRTIAVEGVNSFFRGAGPADGPVVLLTYGWPSSHMVRDLNPKLADRAAAPTALSTRTPAKTIAGGKYRLRL